jgi:hypothetical protein
MRGLGDRFSLRSALMLSFDLAERVSLTFGVW